MLKNEWMDKVRENWDALVDVVMQYHPCAHYSPAPMSITADNAEIACEMVRRHISSEEQPVTVERLERLRDEENVDELSNLFSSAWFGVPESTECWGIEGFGELVELLEDPPDDSVE